MVPQTNNIFGLCRNTVLILGISFFSACVAGGSSGGDEESTGREETSEVELDSNSDTPSNVSLPQSEPSNADNSNIDLPEDDNDFEEPEDEDPQQADDFEEPEDAPGQPNLPPPVVDGKCSSFLTSAPRGIACLQCLQPQARNQARVLLNILRNSCVRNPAMTIMIDGTFSYDDAFLREIVTALTADGRTPFFYYYLSNGASQRQFSTTAIDAFGVRVEPEDFRQRIQTIGDPLRDQYRALVARAVPFFDFALKRGARVFVIPQLEDNLTDAAFNAMLELTLDVIPPELPIAIGRNPCPGCYPGNQSAIPAGLFQDLHARSGSFSVRDGLITNDGRTFRFDFESGSSDDLSMNTMREMRNRSQQLNDAFVPWRADYQGLRGGERPHPSQRNYAIPDQRSIDALIGLLRGGL